jgi:hypothetical protein
VTENAPDRFVVVVGEGVVEPRIEGRFARRVGGAMHSQSLLPELEMAQDALDDILLVDERNDAQFPSALRAPLLVYRRDHPRNQPTCRVRQSRRQLGIEKEPHMGCKQELQHRFLNMVVRVVPEYGKTVLAIGEAFFMSVLTTTRSTGESSYLRSQRFPLARRASANPAGFELFGFVPKLRGLSAYVKGELSLVGPFKAIAACLLQVHG